MPVATPAERVARPSRGHRAARRLVVVAVLVPALFLGGQLALAAFTGEASAGHTVATNTLAAPTNPGTAHGACVLGVSTSITVTWTKTTSTWADGYEVFSSLVAGGPYVSAGTVSGRDTESHTVSGLAFLTGYSFVVQATKGNWRSANSTEVSRTTLSALCT